MEEGRHLLDTVIEQPQTQANATAYVKALLGPVERKNDGEGTERGRILLFYFRRHATLPSSDR